MSKSKVYFTKEITPENVVKLYEHLGVKLPGKVAVKVHSGEEGNQNFLHPEFMRPMIDEVDGTVVECNTAYDGARDTTEKHEKLMAAHGWTEYFDVDIMDADGPSSDIIFPIENGRVLKDNRVVATWRTTLRCSCSLTSKGIRWAALAVRSSSSRSVVLLTRVR